MTWTDREVEAWLKQVEPIANKRSLFDWLEIPPIASNAAIQDAYHQVARTRHPDLFRNKLTPELLDRLVRMYARVTAAYAELRVPEKCAAYLRAITRPPGSKPPPPAEAPEASTPSIEPARAMNARALSFYRRAEGAVRTGDRSSALLHLKMAIAADPKSTFLRAALTELVGEKP